MVITHANFNGIWRRVKRTAMLPVNFKAWPSKKNPKNGDVH
jgi:hypothetical protein